MEKWQILLIFTGFLFLVFLIAAAVRTHARRITTWFSFRPISESHTLDDYARVLLNDAGIADVRVEVNRGTKGFFIGNTYRPSDKTIYLTGGLVARQSLTGLATVCRLAALARMHAEGKRGVSLLNIVRYTDWLSLLFLPLLLVGLVMDAQKGAIGAGILLFGGIGLACVAVSFLLSLCAASVQSRSLAMGQEMILALGVLDPQEEKKMKKLFRAQKVTFILDAIFLAFEMVYLTLQLLFALLSVFGRKKQ